MCCLEQNLQFSNVVLTLDLICVIIVLLGGRCAAGINREGIDYYNELIDTLLAIGWIQNYTVGRGRTYMYIAINFFIEVTIMSLYAAGIEPYVTLFHWDLPHCLEEEYDGFLSKKVV